MIQRFNTHLSMLPVFLHAQRRIWISIPGDHRRVVYLEYEPSLDHRLILAFDKVSDHIEILFVHHVGDGEEERLVVRIVLVL